MNEMEQLREWIHDSDNIVFFGGAGVSTESNIPDFRSVDGLYNQEYDYPPETILSHTFFMRNTPEFYRFYRNKMIFPDAEPNKAHLALAELEKQGKLKAVITQNIDGLHQKAGSTEVLELHGSVLRNYCMKCGKFYNLQDTISQEGVTKCSCGGIIKPDVVAPGNAVISCANRNDNMPYTIKSGTSMSTPVVSGAIALLLEREPWLTNFEIKKRLRRTAKDLGYPHNLQGWGLFEVKSFLNENNG